MKPPNIYVYKIKKNEQVYVVSILQYDMNSAEQTLKLKYPGYEVSYMSWLPTTPDYVDEYIRVSI